MNITTWMLEASPAYTPADETERLHMDRAMKLAFTGERACRRDNFEPGHFTASAFIVYPPSGVVLLQHHRRFGKWMQMGGHIEFGEDPVKAALREGSEESGLPDLELVVPDLVGVNIHSIAENAARAEPAHEHFDLRFLLQTREPEKVLTNSDEAHELEWVELAEARERCPSAGMQRAFERIEAILAARARIETTIKNF